MAIGEDGLAAAAASGTDASSIYYLAKCILRGSAVIQAVQGRFRSSSSTDFVFGKETSLELVESGENGVLQTVSEQTVFGIIKDIAVLRWNDRYYPFIPQVHGRDLLVVISDSGKLSLLAFNSEMHRFLAIAHVELSQPGNARHQLGRMIAVDPEGDFIAVSAYEDNFVIFPVAQISGGSFINDKISYPPQYEEEDLSSSRRSIHGTIWSMCFISSGTNYQSQGHYHPVLAVVFHRRGCAAGNELLLFGYNTKLNKMSIISRYSEFGHLALNIAAVPHFSGFALLFRVGDILVMDLRNPEIIKCIHKINLPLPTSLKERNFIVDITKKPPALDDETMFDEAACALLELRDSGDDIIGSNYDNNNNNNSDNDPMNIDNESENDTQNLNFICSWSWEPSMRTCSKILFCLNTGELYVLEMNFDVEGIRINISECLYYDQPCKSLLWMQGGLVLGLVEMGDGMVLKLENGILEYKGSIQCIAPILDLAIADFHDEKQDQIFACCGMKPDGSVRVIRSGISVDKLVKTGPVYQGVAGTWSLKMKKDDPYHSFVVLSFLEQTRVLSVGLSFNDVTDYVGFQSDVSTLACGLVADLVLVQIHRKGVRLCVPTNTAHPEGVPASVPGSTTWVPPDGLTINVGAIGHNMVLVSTSNPSFLYVLGLKSLSDFEYEIYPIQHVLLQHEISCMSIPHEPVRLTHNDESESEFGKLNASRVVIIGTHKPSIEVISLEPKELFRVLAIGGISVNNSLGCPISGCVPESVRLILSDRVYILAGLRNGMLLRLEWTKLKFFSQSEPSNSLSKSETAILEMIAVRRIGIMPVSLVSLTDSSSSDLILLSDRPWILHSSRQSLAYSSVSFQSASHVTAVKFAECPFGILFVSDNSLHLVEMVHSKRLNVQKFGIEGNARKIMYHKESKTLLVMRTGLSGPLCSSDICQVDPLTGSLVSRFKCDEGETAICFEIVHVGNVQVLIVGTSKSTTGRIILPTGEPDSTKGRLIVLSLAGLKSIPQFDELTSGGSPSSNPSQSDEMMTGGELRLISQVTLFGAVLAVCPYLHQYFLAASGNVLSVFGFVGENPHRMRKFAITRTRFTITCLKSFLRRIAVGDCRDGILFYSYHEELKKLELEFSDRAQRLVGDCVLIDCETVVASDRRGSISVLSCLKTLEAYESPEKNLSINCSFYTGETVMSIDKASFSYKLLVDDVLIGGNGTERLLESSYNSIVASTLLGSVFILIPLNREEYNLLATVQARLSNHRLTLPVLGNDHKEFRRRGAPAGVRSILDGDMLVQFLELTSVQQEAVLMSPGGQSTKADEITVNQVVQTLERVHYALTQ